jgi:hypothetical protein
MLELVRMPPLVGVVRVGGGAEEGEGEVETRAGQVVEVGVELTNRLLEPVSDCSLLIRLQQDTIGKGEDARKWSCGHR